jgi:hypothetical protein
VQVFILYFMYYFIINHFDWFPELVSWRFHLLYSYNHAVNPALGVALMKQSHIFCSVRKCHVSRYSFKKSPVLKDHFFLCPKVDLLIQVWLYRLYEYKRWKRQLGKNCKTVPWGGVHVPSNEKAVDMLLYIHTLNLIGNIIDFYFTHD